MTFTDAESRFPNFGLSRALLQVRAEMLGIPCSRLSPERKNRESKLGWGK